MRSPSAELRKASSRRGYLHPFKSFSTSRVPRHVEPSPEREEKPKKEGRGFFSQLRRSLTLSHRSSSSPSPVADRPAPTAARLPAAAAASKEGVQQPPWGRRVKHGLSKPLKMVKTSYVDCMMGIAEDPRVEGLATTGFQHSNSQAYAFQASASRRVQNSPSSVEAGLVPPTDAQLQALLRSSKRHAHVFSSE